MSAVQIASFVDNRIRLNLAFLKNTLTSIGNRPVAIVSINGPMRTGKSYMLGHFLKYLKANGTQGWFDLKLRSEFHWQSSAERQTTGIMMWSEPFYVQQNGHLVAILLMDTQGCFDEKTTTHENHLIFALSCLLSSVLIYNIQNKLSEDVLQFLQLFIGYAKASMEYTSSEAFSKLVFLIRDWEVPKDFAFGYHDDHVTAGKRNYKREKLNMNSSMAREVQVVHREILSSFQSVECCLMPHPGKDLARNDDTTKLDDEFIDTIKDFVPRIFSCDCLITKKVGGKEVTGLEFKRIVQEWSKLFENSKIPEVKNVTEATAQTQAMMAYSIAVKFYKGEMEVVKSNKGMRVEELDRLHQTTKEQALDLFNKSQRIRIAEIEKKTTKRLKDEIDHDYKAWRDINIIINEFKNYKAESQAEREKLEKELKERIENVEKKHHEEKLFFATLGDVVDKGLVALGKGVSEGGEKVWNFFKGWF